MSEGIKCKAENPRNIRTVSIKYVHVVPAFNVTVRMCFRRAREKYRRNSNMSIEVRDDDL